MSECLSGVSAIAFVEGEVYRQRIVVTTIWPIDSRIVLVACSHSSRLQHTSDGHRHGKVCFHEHHDYNYTRSS